MPRIDPQRAARRRRVGGENGKNARDVARITPHFSPGDYYYEVVLSRKFADPSSDRVLRPSALDFFSRFRRVARSTGLRIDQRELKTASRIGSE